MPLEITVRTTSSIPLEVDSVRLDAVRELTADDVKSIPIQRGNQALPLGEFFDVTGSAAEDDTLVWRGDCSRVKSIGQAQAAGTLVVEGDVGMHLGAAMTGGRIEVRGNAADWVGAEMQGGVIHVRGNAGHLVGAVYRGGRRGMKGGVILVDGDAGNEVGHTMRRGLIAIGGRTGDATAFNMIAGTILAMGETGIRPGAGMRRGTLIFTGDTPQVLPTFKPAGQHRPLWLRIYLLRVRTLGLTVPDEFLDATFDRYDGDFLETGKGEILVRTAA